MSVTEAIEAIKRFNADKPNLNATVGDKEEQNDTTSQPNPHNKLQARVDILEKEVAELKRALQLIIGGHQ
ncbi:hypothetical protein [Alteromonas gracilis]|uniref:hypothetical protein n=1 Tax=Alteromonas gracilis TaxID=1479524 RepID=UPI003735BDD7